MPLRADAFDLGGLRLTAGEARRLELVVALDPLELGGQRYRAEPSRVVAVLDVSKTTGDGHALRLRFQARLAGLCMRCLSPAEPLLEVDAREVSQPGAGAELQSPYVEHGLLDLRAWARDTLALAMPVQVLCSSECAGLCPICGIDLNQADPEHAHERPPEARWAKLSELKLDR